MHDELEIEGGVAFRFRGDIRCGVRSRLGRGEMRRFLFLFFIVEHRFERIVETVCDRRKM